MRSTGQVLTVLGTLLTISIAAAFIGLPMMAVGIVLWIVGKSPRDLAQQRRVDQMVQAQRLAEMYRWINENPSKNS